MCPDRFLININEFKNSVLDQFIRFFEISMMLACSAQIGVKTH